MKKRFHRVLLAAVGAILAASAPAKTPLGAPLALEKPTPIGEVLGHPDRFVGRPIQVRGKVSAVCEMMGCWMNLVDPATSRSIRVKVNDGEIIFPKEAVGKTALAEGKLEKLDLTREQAIERARHEAEERGRMFDPASVTGPVTIYQLRGTGAVILD